MAESKGEIIVHLHGKLSIPRPKKPPLLRFSDALGHILLMDTQNCDETQMLTGKVPRKAS